MTRDPRTPMRGEPYDDGAIEQLVRDVAAGWAMPPVRLDAPGWRERVRGGRARRLDAASGWLRRLGQAATAAVALTVAAALVAVVLTRPPVEPGSSPDATDPATSGATPAAQASLLPKRLIQGAVPQPSTVLVQTDPGDYGLVDLEMGTISGGLTGTGFGSELRVLEDGSMVCLCLVESGNEDGQPTHTEVKLERYDATGKRLESITVAVLGGGPDPRDAGQFVPERPAHILTALSFSGDGLYGFVGSSVRAHPTWQSALVRIDLETGRAGETLRLPELDTGRLADTRRVADAPRVIGSTTGDGLLVARAWYSWSPPYSEAATYSFGTEIFRVDLTGGEWSNLAPSQLAGDCGDRVLRGGALADGGTWVACSNGRTATTILRRVDAAGTLLPDIRIQGGDGIEGDITTVDRDGRSLFVWDPATGVLTKVDIESGTISSAEGLTARTGVGTLAAFGHWLAPSASAKSFLRGAVILSPDGSRAYALGVKEGLDPHEFSGSAGVFVFDVATMERIGEIWQPTADFISLALSADGRFAYAAGMPGVDEKGQRRAGQLASITVFDTADGSVRLIAGQLGASTLTFTAPALD